MNLIIDIPNERYELLKAVNKQLGRNGATPEELAILNGVPLKEVADDIKAEINQEYLAEGHSTDYWNGIDKCMQIIDKHISGKENI